MGACCSKAQVTDIESVGSEPAQEHIPAKEIQHNSAVEWPDLLDLNSIPRGGTNNAFKAAIAVVPVTKLTRKQCALPQKILALLSPVSLIDVKFKDIDTYQDVNWSQLGEQAELNRIVLDLSLNRLKKIPHTSFSSAILSLNLSGNMLVDISGLTSCSGLQALDASDNQISDMSPILACSQLLVLMLNRNKINTVAFGGSQLCNTLKTLELNENKNLSLHGMIKLLKLDVLEVRKCDLESIDDLFGLSHLSKLDVSCNNISDMNETLCAVNSMQSLLHLNASNNPICSDKFYLAKILEATMGSHLLSLDMRQLGDEDYQVVIDVTENPNKISPELLPEKVKDLYQHRKDILLQSSIDKKDASANDPVVAGILREATGDMNATMNSLINYVREVTTSNESKTSELVPAPVRAS